MIKRRAILILNDLEYEIPHCGYRFTRKVDAKGRPISGIRGGDIWTVLESGKNNRILSMMLLKSIPASKGYIALLGGEDYQCIRRIEFEKAYIYSHGEQMQADAARPMMTQVHITPLRLDVNANVRLDRRWSETSGFHWQKYEEPEMKYAKAAPQEEKKNMKIVDAYWNDKKNRTHRVLFTSYPVKLHVVLEEYIEGETVDFCFKNNNDDMWQPVHYSGIVNSKGIVIIEDFQLTPKK